MMVVADPSQKMRIQLCQPDSPGKIADLRVFHARHSFLGGHRSQIGHGRACFDAVHDTVQNGMQN